MSGPQGPGEGRSTGAVGVNGPTGESEKPKENPARAREKPVRLGLIGFGKQGQRYVETAKEMGIETVPIKDGGVDGVIIATPPDSHVDYAIKYLRADLPVMIEKPVALSFDDAESLIPPQYENMILVNHTYLFAPAYERLKELLVPPIVRIDIDHYGSGPARDYSGLYDYGSHGVAMCLDLMGGRSDPTCKAWKRGTDWFDMRLTWDAPRVLLRVGSGTAEKRCWMRVQTATQVLEYNGLLGQLHLNGTVQDLYDERTPLNKAIGVFVGLIQGKSDPRAGMGLPLRVMAALDEANKSITHAPLFDWEIGPR